MTTTRSVVHGEWYAVLGDEVVVLLPPAAKARVAGVWERVDAGACFDEVLDALVSGGLRGLPGFVLVSDRGGDVTVVIRGPGEARLTTADGPVIISGDEESTWVERRVPGVTALRLRVADDEGDHDGDGDGPAYTVRSGLVRVSALQQPATPAAADTGPLAASSTPAPEPDDEGPATERIPATTIEPIAPAVVPPQPSLRPSSSGAHAAGPVARLVFSDGQVVDVDRAVVVGRSPQPRGVGGGDEPRSVTVQSPHQEISATHLEIRPGAGPDHGSAVVTDLASTNGTLVVQPGLPAEDLQPGIAVQLVPGALVDLGDGVTIQITSV